jgi:hypothetical protein
MLTLARLTDASRLTRILRKPYTIYGKAIPHLTYPCLPNLQSRQASIPSSRSARDFATLNNGEGYGVDGLISAINAS